VVRIHGLAIQAGFALPGLAARDAGSPDVELELVDRLPPPVAARLRYRAGTADDPGSRVEIVDDASGRTSFRYGDGTAVDVVHLSRPARIRAAIAPGQTLEDLTAYLYGPVLGFLLRAWGRLALHASCIRIGDSAVLVAGDSGAGKSTTAAALAARGMAVISDDLTALSTHEGRLLAWPAFDHLRLWPDAAEDVLHVGRALDRITPTWEKRRFPLVGGAFADEPCAVSAIVVLRPRAARRRAVSRPIAPARALLTLATLTYANYLLDPRMRATELSQLGALVRAVPVHSLAPPSGRAGLDALCDAVQRIAARHAAPSPA
jgi:hypothetical protein